jgi:cytochrome c-type biogenesis protein CcmH
MFWVVAAGFGIVALLSVLVPTWTTKRRTGHWSVAGLVSAIAIIPGASALYLSTSTWNPDDAERAANEVRAIAQLAEHMQRNPNDVRGWRLLGNSYMALGKYMQARAAFNEAWQRTPLPDTTLKVELAESQVFAEQHGLTGQAIRLFEEVLVSEPTNQKALWYAALAAEQLGNDYVARRHLTELVNQTLTSDIRRTVEQKLASLPPPDDSLIPSVDPREPQ